MYFRIELKNVVIGLLVLLLSLSIAHAQDSLNVTCIGSFPFEGPVIDVDLEGNLVAVAAGVSGLLIFDVTDPQTASLIAQIDTFSFASNVDISGGYVYLTAGQFPSYLYIIDITDPASPVFVSEYEMGDFGVNMDVYEGYVYISEANWGDLHIVDATHPNAPCFGGLFFVNGFAWGMDFYGNYAFLAEWFDCTFMALDITNPADPIELCSIDLGGIGCDVSISGNYAYVTTYYTAPGMKVVDISDPSNLIEVGSCTIPGSAKGVTALDDFVFVAASSSGLRVLNISNPTNPYEVGYYDTPGVSWDVAAAGNFAFLADYDWFSIYDCSAAMSSDINITLTPLNPPVTIPAAGGSFNFNVAIANNGSTPQVFDAWIMVTLPDSSLFGPVLGPVNLTLAAGAAIDRDRTQNVPAGAPAGTYIYEGLVGVYPDDVWDSDSFTFEKLEVGDGAPVNNWSNTGESLDLWFAESPEVIPSEFKFFDAYPNPFNPTTVLSFQLPVAGLVKLDIFDINGRKVGASPRACPGSHGGLLLQDWYPPGTHHILFDGTGLPSGIYLARLTVGDFSQVRKLVLMK